MKERLTFSGDDWPMAKLQLGILAAVAEFAPKPGASRRRSKFPVRSLVVEVLVLHRDVLDSRPRYLPNCRIGAEMVARAAPDGYTLLYAGSSSQIMRVHLSRNTPYDPVRDFTPISRASGAVLAVLANASLPAATLKEFIDYARRNPGKISFASSGIGTNHHLSAELLKQVTGINIVHVPYKNGAQVLTGLITDQVPIAFGIIATAMPYVKSGKVRVLAINGTERYKGMPQVATIGEQVPGYVPPPGWSGFFGPAGLPAPIVSRLNKVIVAALSDPAFRAKAEGAGLILSPSTPEEFAADVRRDLDAVGRIVKAAGLKPE